MTFDEWWDKTYPQSEASNTRAFRDLFRDCWHAAQAQCAAGEWRPIAEAPEDGTLCLLRHADGSMGINIHASRGINIRASRELMADWGVTHFAPLREVQS